MRIIAAGARPLSVMFFALGALALAVYPLRGHWLAAILPAYGVLLWWRPGLWLFALPALLPALDLTPRTGWFFLEEIDLLLLITAGFTYWRLQGAGADSPRWPALFSGGLILLAVACASGLWRGLQPWSTLDANALNNYLSPYNALRVGKAWIWTLILLPPLRHAVGPQLQGLRRHLLPGMLTGLLLVVCAAIVERWRFPGLANFSSNYRISAPFSAMHTGGAALDGYLALSAPLLAIWLFGRHAPLKTAGALALLALALYAGLATFSRGLYLAYAAAVVVLIVFRLAIQRDWKPVLAAAACALAALAALDIGFRAAGYRVYGIVLILLALALLAALPRRHLAGAMATLLALASVVPIYHGYFVSQRFSTASSDLDGRWRHWRQTLAMMDDGAATALLGMGLGKFPSTYYWRNPRRETPPGYRYLDQDGNRFLRLNAGYYPAGYGELLRMLQVVKLQENRRYLLGVDVRNGGAIGFLHVNLCERELLYPQNCLRMPLHQIPHALYWRRYQFAVNAGVLGASSLPLRLEVAAEGQDAAIDLDNISLRALPDGHELLRNGDFADANNYWFFSSDRHHLPWHVKNLGLNLYFEMGWLGLLAYAALLSSAFAALVRQAWVERGGGTAPALLAALVAFQVVGLFDSLLDVPRITLLSTLLLCAAALQPTRMVTRSST
jgi:hypothetical protein